MQDEQHRTRRAGAGRIPDLVWIAWLIAFGVLVLLAVNVVRHLSAPGSGQMAGMQMPTGEAIFREGGSGPFGPLLSMRLITDWQVNSVALAVLAVLAAWYLSRLALLRRRRPDVHWPVGYTISFLLGLGVCAYATCGAIAVYDEALFSAHMLGHLALVMAAPALLVAGCPLKLAGLAGKEGAEARIRGVLHSPLGSLLTSPPVALACYAAVIVGTHLTGLMDTIMRVTWAGQVEHLVYLLVGWQLFVLVLGDEPIRWRLSTPVRWLLLVVAMAVDTFTGVILMMSSTPVAMSAPPSLHVDPLSDTHTGGAVMWFGGDAIMAAVMIVLVLGWLRTSGQSQRDVTGWLAQARIAALGERANVTADKVSAEFDDSDDRLAAYNAWLANLADHEAEVKERARPDRS